ncbi:unnamed protein product [Leptosia nina]|uniref:Uncharacterized protein n=1 Tax=Leptosia nina TaxID=320188 RepID=A0AAV1JQK0_9NEOP
MRQVVVFCFLLFTFESNGGILKDIVKEVHEKTTQIREDIRNVFRNGGKKDEIIVSSTNSTQTSVNKTNDEIAKYEIGLHMDEILDMVFPSSATTEITKEMVKSTEIYFDTTNNETKDGRDSFEAAKCATDFKKTQDGRCKKREKFSFN